MARHWALLTILVLATAATLAACGSSGTGATTTDPVATTEGYMKAVEGGKADGGTEFLETNISNGIPLTGATSASKYMASNKGSKWEVATVNYPDPGATAAKPTKKACLVTPPQGGQLCIVTVTVSSAKPAYFHFAVETRYDAGWRILNVDEVDGKPDNLLPTGNEAHIS